MTQSMEISYPNLIISQHLTDLTWTLLCMFTQLHTPGYKLHATCTK